MSCVKHVKRCFRANSGSQQAFRRRLKGRAATLTQVAMCRVFLAATASTVGTRNNGISRNTTSVDTASAQQTQGSASTTGGFMFGAPRLAGDKKKKRKSGKKGEKLAVGGSVPEDAEYDGSQVQDSAVTGTYTGSYSHTASASGSANPSGSRTAAPYMMPRGSQSSGSHSAAASSAGTSTPSQHSQSHAYGAGEQPPVTSPTQSHTASLSSIGHNAATGLSYSSTAAAGGHRARTSSARNGSSGTGGLGSHHQGEE